MQMRLYCTYIDMYMNAITQQCKWDCLALIFNRITNQLSQFDDILPYLHCMIHEWSMLVVNGSMVIILYGDIMPSYTARFMNG